MGTDTTLTAAVAALSSTGGTIGIVHCQLKDEAKIAIPYVDADNGFVIEGIGQGIHEDRYQYGEKTSPEIWRSTSGDNDEIFELANNALLTIRGVTVHQDRGKNAIKGGSNSLLVIEDSYVHCDAGTADTIDGAYVRIRDSVVTSAGGDPLDSSVVWVEATESRLSGGSGYCWNGPFGQVYFEKCVLSKFQCDNITGSSRLRMDNCKVDGVKIIGGAHTDISVTDCDIDGGAGHAIELGYSSAATFKRAVVSANRMKTTGGHGLYLSGHVLGLAASGNTCQGNAAGYTVEGASSAYFGGAPGLAGNAHDGSMAGVYGTNVPATATVTPHNLLDGAVHDDTAADSVTEGSLIVGNATPAWDELVISVPAANVRNVLGVDNGETGPSWKAALDGTNPAAVAATASAGTSLVFAHRDHVHALGVGTTRGDLIVWNSTPVASRLAVGAAGTVLIGGTDPSYSGSPALSGALTVDTINEYTGDAGVTIEGSLLKDSYISVASDAAFLLSIVSSNTRITFDTDDWLEYDRGSDFWRFAIGGAATVDIWDAGMRFHSGTFMLGNDLVDQGKLILYGQATGQAQGGYISIYTSDDYDHLVVNYVIDTCEDDLRIYRGAAIGIALKGDADVVELSGALHVDTIDEKTGAAGVTVETVLIKDGAVDGRDVSVDGTKLDGVATGADVTGDNAPQAHAASHQSGGGDAIKLDDLSAPDDNTDLDFSTTAHGLVPKGTNVGDFLKDDGTWAAPAGGGTVDTSGTPVDDDYAKFTDADTIEGRSYAEVKQDLGLEIGTDVLAQQTIGIADDNLLEVDDADAADDDYAKFTANGLEGRDATEMWADVGGDAKAIAAVEGEVTLDLTGDATIAAGKSLAVDTIGEKTGAAGVTLDGVLAKDYGLTVGGNQNTDDQVLLKFDINMDWQFETIGVGVGQSLGLRALAAAQHFKLLSADGTEGADFLISDTDANNKLQISKLEADYLDELTAAAGVTIDGCLLKDGNVDGRDVSADGTKLDAIEAAADVTDATNVNAAGATMNADTDLSGNGYVLDEDAMDSDDDTKVPTQQSVKAYVDGRYVTHQMVFSPETEGMTAAVLLPERLCVGESGEHGAFTAIRAKATAGTAGANTNTILIEADDNPAFSSATTLFTIALDAATEADDATLDNTWASGDIWIRARCSAVDATEPEKVVVEFFFKEKVWA